ncbi:hypothetical protein [Streptomyces sp. NPDC059247]|uniref:hypothetical protein n=1 Tax=Streptomyces sp. NPDC059247 TaxID=3346790 RepID=UPI0036AA2D38
MDHLAVANWMFLCVNAGEDGDQPDPPKPVPRPGLTNEDEDEDGSEDGDTSAFRDEGGAPATDGRSAPGEEGAVSPQALARFFG